MKIQNLLRKVGITFMAPFLLVGTSSAVPLYFDQNGTDAGFGIANTATYDWGNGTPSVWNTNSSGGSGTFSAWNNALGNIATFGSAGATGWGVNLTSDLTVGGLAFSSGAVASGSSMTFSAASARTLTLNTGAEVTLNQGGSRSIIFGNNVNLSGSFTLTSSSSVSQAGLFALEGTGSQYTGTITTSGNVSITTLGASRFGTGTKLVLNEGGILTSNSNTANLTFGELSGNGGVLNRSSFNYTVTIDQTTTTSWAGQLASPDLGSYKFAKSSVGTLVLNGTAAHHIAQSVTINGGALFVNANFAATSNAANGILVGTSGNFGGVTTSEKHVTLNGATSQLTPGMYNTTTSEQQVGKLTLANGLTAANGGTFNFTLNGDDGAGNTVNSLIEVTGGTLTLSGIKTANFFNLGTGEIQEGTAYTIFRATGITTSGWTLGQLPSGWEFGSFTVAGNDLQVTFNAIPEPSAAVLIVAFSLLALFVRRYPLRKHL